MGISPEIIEEIKGRLNLVDVVSGYLPLRRAGRNFLGLCPFHKEKTPSFTVNPERQFFHCFGCKASGDLISFVMKIENLNFNEAVELLAERAGVEIPEDDKGAATEALEGIRRAYEVAAEYYQEMLFSKDGKVALGYLEGRGISQEWAKRFGMGYAPSEAAGLLRAEERAGMARKDLVEWGLLGRREDGSLYGRFRHRLMIPIHDEKGRVIAFGGRALEEHQEPKYLNSPDTRLFRKGRTLYAYHQARKVARDRGLVLVEGYMDVVACHLHGFTQAVAALGTAFTETQARKIERLTKNVVLLFDSDEAGWKATLRTGEVFLQHNIVPLVVRLPEGEDPDSFLRKEGADQFSRILDNAQDFLIAVFENGASAYDLSRADQLSAYAKEMALLVGKLRDPVMEDSYLMELSKRTGIDRAILRSATKGKERFRKRVEVQRGRGGIHWEEMLLGVIFAKPSLWLELREELDPSLFRIEFARRSVEAIERYASPQMAIVALEDGVKEKITRAMMEIPPGAEDDVARGCLDRLRARRLKLEIQEVKEALSVSQNQEDKRALSERYMGLMRDLKKMRRGDEAHEEL